VVVLQHIDCEPAAAYADELRARDIAFEDVRLYAGDPLPDLREVGALIAMGGPMGTSDESQHPWLRPEKELIARAVQNNVPYWGICLGAQLLAASLGGAVAPGPAPEVGVLPVELTAAAASDPVFAGAPARFEALQWHGDTWELPAGAVRLACSEQYPEQAFVFKRAYGLQFHLEADSGLVTDWGDVSAYAESLAQLRGDDALPALVDAVSNAQVQMLDLARSLFGRWLDCVAAVRSPVAGS
jgi:GMP synthase-like glutamine amidotransferase